MTRRITARRVGSLIAGASALVVTASLASCSIAVPGDSGEQHTLSVVTTTSQLADFTRQVGADHVGVVALLPPGASAHRFDPSPRELLALAAADAVVINGAGLDDFVFDALEASGFDGAVIDASAGIDLELARTLTERAEHEAEGDGEHGGHDHDHDHDHGDVNPHLWTAPDFAAGMAREVASGLAERDPDHAADYETAAARYEERLDALDRWVGAQFDRVPEEYRVLVSGHDSLRYYLDAYGIRFAGAILPSFEDNAEPSAREIDRLSARMRELGVRAVFVESSMSPQLARALARESGATVVDESRLYADALGATGSGAETYIDATVHNTRLILETWGYDADPIPKELAP